MKAKFKLLLLFLLVSSFIYAQQQKITGTVTSADDSLPLPGVNIIEKGTTNGTNTDFDGNYSITVGQGAILEFSSLGFKTVSITVGAQTSINLAMETDVESLGEVVVIGYGTAEKERLNGFNC